LIRAPGNMLPGSRNRRTAQERGRLASREPHLRLRARMLHAIRLFFLERDYLEVETPYLIPAPAPEPHIDAYRAGSRFLHTSPELCMKRLLAAGYPRIFQIGKCFRYGERGHMHLPEFTMLEWYRTEIDYRKLMEECESLLVWVSGYMGLDKSIRYQGEDIDLTEPWERKSVSRAFEEYAGLTPKDALEKGVFDRIMVERIEPNLGMQRPVFLFDYPAPLASLARLRPDNRELAERFELYMGGIEIANGFSELADSNEQRIRFERDSGIRQRMGKPPYPRAENFLESLKHMPEAAGIALGVDRLAMIIADSKEIDNVVSFTPEEV
jgi:elongation factor P--(R)-beta-lysine ligase